MTTQPIENATFGQLLAAADARFEREGGYKATAWCEDRRVDLLYQEADGTDRVISSAPMPQGIAPEDIAHELLVAEVGPEGADRYYVVTLR